MSAVKTPRPDDLSDDFRQMLGTLSEGSVHVHFDPYEDIDWTLPVDREDPRWVLDPHADQLGAHPWYQAQPLADQVSIGRVRFMNAIRTGAVFETLLVRSMMHYVTTLENFDPQFRYCLHEMTEECNHIQMFQELVNTVGEDVQGPHQHLRRALPTVAFFLGHFPMLFMLAILAGEEPIDHYQKAVVRGDGDAPELVQRAVAIHIAEEARHISFADAWLRLNVPRASALKRFAISLWFPLTMRIGANEIIIPPYREMARVGVPKDVYVEAFLTSAKAHELMAGYFNDMRRLALETGLINRTSKALWKRLGIWGEPSRYRGEPDRTAQLLS
jgi:hypothetical protein